MMKLISLLLASVEASKLTSRASAKNKAQFLSGTEFDSLFSDLNTQLDALDAYDYTYTNDWDTNWDSGYSDYSYDWDTDWDTDYSTNWWETPETNYDAGSCVNTDNGAHNWYNEDCSDYEANPSWCGFWNGNGFVSEDMCCVCDGGEIVGAPEADLCEANEDKADSYGDTCYEYWSNPHWCGHTNTGFDSNADCCACQ